MTMRAGRHFLQIPGPTNVPDRVLRAMDRPTMDHRSETFGELTRSLKEPLQRMFGCSGHVVVYPASGSGAWEAALANTLSPGDKVLMYETGHFAKLWAEIATLLGLEPIVLSGSWRAGADAEAIGQALKQDRNHEIKAVCVVHNETSTGCVSPIWEVREAIDAAGHPALLMADTISSLGSIPYSADEWGVDVTIGGSQKGLMLPPGLSFNAVSDKALAASRTARLPRSYWDWSKMIEMNKGGYFPYTPATNMLYGLKEALAMLEEEGHENVFARHARHAEATRAAVRHWGLETQCGHNAHHSNSLTAVRLPEGHSADRLRAIISERFNMSLGNGLSKLADRVFRIGHLGDFNDLTLMGALSGVEMGLSLAGVPHQSGGVQAAMNVLKREETSTMQPIEQRSAAE